MKVKELIKKIEALPSLTSITSIRPYVDKKIVLGLISQLDEPEKVTIPQFIADKYGYEVEKEKRYLVKMKNIDTNSAYLKHQLQNNHWYWGSLTECGAFSPYHTKKELEADDFGWVFDCEVVEVEEVEE